MLKIKILVIGKIKEKSVKTIIEEYTKRLQSYCNLDIIEYSDEKAPEKLSLSQQEIIKSEEAKKQLKGIGNNDFVIALTLDGVAVTSEGLAEKIEKIQVDGNSTITFLIGGSLGLGNEVINRANLKVSLSKLTFPHQLARLILIEQIYRSFRILNNEPYHK